MNFYAKTYRVFVNTDVFVTCFLNLNYVDIDNCNVSSLIQTQFCTFKMFVDLIRYREYIILSNNEFIYLSLNGSRCKLNVSWVFVWARDDILSLLTLWLNNSKIAQEPSTYYCLILLSRLSHPVRSSA